MKFALLSIMGRFFSLLPLINRDNQGYINSVAIKTFMVDKCGLERGEWKNLQWDHVRKIIGGILLVSLCLLGFYQPFKAYVQIPQQVTLLEGETFQLQKTASATAFVQSAQQKIGISEEENKLTITGEKIGSDEVILKLAGIPIKKLNVDVKKNLKMMPGGQSIGVKLNTLGVLVVGHHLVDSGDEKKSPGEEAGIKVGDIIMNINGNKIEKMEDVTPIVQKAGEEQKPLQMMIQRDKEKINTTLMPLKDKAEHFFKLGLYIRDSAAGIGTMTFYEPKSKKYGALGHVISDMDTKKPIVVEDGQLVKSTVTSIEKGINGNPGEKLADFSPHRKVIGNIKKNSPFGIFGHLKEDLKNGVFDQPMSIALSHQVKEGPAQILTVVDGDKVHPYDIEIVTTIPQKFPATKGMVIKVTDPDLLKKTGGIVQGMSGSPIIQDGKLIGAVTHVFVNDPTSGYGVHIEWMLNDAGIDMYESQQDKAS